MTNLPTSRFRGIGRVGLGFLLAALGGLTGAAIQSRQGPLEASSFVLRDDNGVKRAELSVTPNGTGLTIYNKSGKASLGLTVYKDVPAVELYDQHDRIRIAADVGDDVPKIMLFDSEGKKKAQLAVTSDAEPSLAMFQRDETALILMSGRAANGLVVYNRDQGWKAPAAMFAVTGKDRGPTCALFGKDEEMTWGFPR